MAKKEYDKTITFNEKLILGDNTTPEHIVDELGLARELKKEGERRENFYKEALKGRTDDFENEIAFEGDQFECEVIFSERTGISGPLVEEDLGQEECRERGYYKTSSVTTIKTKRSV